MASRIGFHGTISRPKVAVGAGSPMGAAEVEPDAKKDLSRIIGF
jgi:hypothetical protein